VRWEIPGSRQGPNEQELERFEALWARLPQLLDLIRPHAAVELEDCHDAVAGTRDEVLTRALMERVAQDRTSLDQDWVLCGVGIHEGERGKRYWTLEFDVTWDIEHQRMAYLDMEGGFVLYDLSCAVVEL
jgi:hypothetical protein